MGNYSPVSVLNTEARIKLKKTKRTLQHDNFHHFSNLNELSLQISSE